MSSTATAGVDYSSIQGTTLRFSENSPSSSCVNVSIREDNVLEDTEMFTVTLTDIPSEGIVVRPDLAAITISDVTGTFLQDNIVTVLKSLS